MWKINMTFLITEHCVCHSNLQEKSFTRIIYPEILEGKGKCLQTDQEEMTESE